MSTSPVVATGVPAGPTPAADRAATPDIARGLALLGIAIANSVVQLYGRPAGPGGRQIDSSWIDHVVDGIVTLTVDNRAFCLFALLYGYGMHQLLSRQLARGSTMSDVRLTLLRRCGALVILGIAHGVLLYDGDILASYGVLGLLIVVALTANDRTLLALAVVFTVALAWLDSFDGTGGPTSGDATIALGPMAALQARASDSMYGLYVDLTVGTGLLAPMLIGVLLARRGILDRPAEHLTALRRLAVGGIAVSLLGAVPLTVTVTSGGRIWGDQGPWLAALQGVTGLGAGVGYPALIGLWVARRQRRSASIDGRAGSAYRALIATGQRSASSYVGQSVLLVPLLASYGLALGGRMTSASVALLAIGVWLTTVLASTVLARWGTRGPAEWFLRRIGYGSG